MNKINIFVYWVGNQEIRENIIKKFKNLEQRKTNFKVHIGPTDKEHNYLMNNFVFYKHNFENKIYAFSSDLYRCWKMSNNEGLYIDANSIINFDKLDELELLIDQYQNIFIKENGHLIWNGIFYSREKELFKKILYFYKLFPFVCSNLLTGPQILSIFVYKFFGTRNQTNSNTLFLDARDIDPFSNNETIFKYNGFGSWGINKQVNFKNNTKSGAHNYFHQNAINFEKGYSRLWRIIRWCIKHYLIYLWPYIFSKKLIKKHSI